MTSLHSTFKNTLLASLMLMVGSVYATDSDGPYVFYKDKADEFEARWMCDLKQHRQTFSHDKKTIVKACDLSAELGVTSFKEQPISYDGDFKIAAFSDMHGQYELSRRLLINNGIIDENNDWAFGNGHLVITGDVFDRGDKVTEILWLLYKLDEQAQLAGGKLHLLLGNHEVMVLNGDLRYLHPKYVNTAKVLQQPFEALFGKDTVLGKWLRSKAVLAKVNGYLFAHGGFHPDLAKKKYSLYAINREFKTNLVKTEIETPRSEFGSYLHKTNGPIWYRGYFKDNGASAEEIELLLHHFNVKKIIVGHTSQSKIEDRFKGKVLAIDTSIKKGKYGEILFIEQGAKLDEFYRGTLDGQKLKLSFDVQ